MQLEYNNIKNFKPLNKCKFSGKTLHSRAFSFTLGFSFEKTNYANWWSLFKETFFFIILFFLIFIGVEIFLWKYNSRVHTFSITLEFAVNYIKFNVFFLLLLTYLFLCCTQQQQKTLLFTLVWVNIKNTKFSFSM